LALFETDLSKRRVLLEKAVETAPEMMMQAKDSGYSAIIYCAHHVFSKTLAFLATTEERPTEKKRLLEESLKHRDETIKITEQLYPYDYWNRGTMLASLANIKSEISELIDDPKAKTTMVQEAIVDLEKALASCTKVVTLLEKEAVPPVIGQLGRWQYQLGGLLNRLYDITDESAHLRKAAKAFEEAAQSYQKLGLVSRVAECYWKIAQASDALGEHPRAAVNFSLASVNYKTAAERIPQLRDFYFDHASYMQAWSEIEKAKNHHVRQEYGSAKEHFENAANLHKSLRSWHYLAPNYAAWASVEKAEELSRKEEGEEAINAFEQAIELFQDTETSLQVGLRGIESSHEKRMAENILKATDLRREYCTARITLEEARILDKKGDHYSSSEKYNLAAENFERINTALDSEQERKELKPIISLTRAWQKMTLAEAETSPALYVEASQLFEEAKEHSPNERTKMLLLGHSRFCRALEAGTRFADTRDRTMYVSAMQCLESAANYYLKAGFQKACEYAKATELLFDAYLHIDDAKKESDPEKRARLFLMVEKVLQTSAGSFMKAEHPEKREQVLGLLEKVKEERELALSLTEVLHAPSIVSTTTSILTPAPSQEEAVGLEKFEHANIQANASVRPKELKLGESLNFDVELVNAGKGPALLIKIAEIIPRNFELAENPENYRIEEDCLNIKGKRLDSLKTEQIRLVLKPKTQGTFYLKPRILYLDENGRYKAHELEPIEVTVKELGIKGWLKGER
jgi:tetratricopeptide (TPR) repeat protein